MDIAAAQAIPDKSVVKVLRKETVKLVVSMYEASKTYKTSAMRVHKGELAWVA